MLTDCVIFQLPRYRSRRSISKRKRSGETEGWKSDAEAESHRSKLGCLELCLGMSILRILPLKGSFSKEKIRHLYIKRQY